MTLIGDLPKPSDEQQAKSAALTHAIRQDIIAHGGLLPFANFMQHALYHPQYGYYQSPSFTLGKMGDFTTAPQISPLFAQCFAHQALQIFNHIGYSNVLELGAGTGQFALDFLQFFKSINHTIGHYFIYEISPALREKQYKLLAATHPDWLSRITWINELPNDFKGVIIANEVMDALPIHRFSVTNKAIKECYTSVDENEFSWKTAPSHSAAFIAYTEKIQHECQMPDNYTSEINLNLTTFIPQLANALSQGVILLADYGYGRLEYYHPARNTGTLMCFYQHHKHDNPLILPGLQDITAHVDFTHVIEIASDYGCELNGYTTQAAFLMGNDLMRLAELTAKNADKIAEVNLNQQIKMLTMPSEMGERIKIMALSKNIESRLAGFALQDRRRDLVVYV